MALNDKTAAWIQARIDEQAPVADLDEEGLRRRLGALHELSDALEGTKGSVELFGMGMRDELLADARTRFAPAVKAMRDRWQAHLEQATVPFKRVASLYGYTFVDLPVTAPRAPTRSPQVDAALDRLLGALERRPIAYWIDETPTSIFLDSGDDPPSQLEGLYARINGLAIYPAKKRGRHKKLAYDSLVIEPADDAEELEFDGREFITLHKHEAGRLLICALDDGSVWQIASRGEPPLPIAPTLADYLDLLASDDRTA